MNARGRTSTAVRESISTVPGRRCWRSSPSPTCARRAEAVAYARALHALVRWIGICDGNMQEGSFRCDANVSVRPVGQAEFGTRREIKNLNSFRFMQQAIDYEVQWQIATLEDGGRIEQATVLFDPQSGETRAMRSKEDAHDYRYFPDPDLLPLIIDRQWIDEIRSATARTAGCPTRSPGRRVRTLGLRRQAPDQLARTGRLLRSSRCRGRQPPAPRLAPTG
jgi:Asp-tRNA(Asn)/Glu-tRNA(Gln) amidotransferase B subunit